MKKTILVTISTWLFLVASLSASTSRIYVVNGAGDSVDVIDPRTDKVVQRIQNMEGAFSTAVSRDGTRIFISDEFKDLVYVVDSSTRKIIKAVSIKGHPAMMAISRNGEKLFVNLESDPPEAGIAVIDTSSLVQIRTIPTRAPMHDLYLSEDGKYLISGSDIGRFIVVVDTETEQPLWDLTFDERVYTMAIESRPDGSPNRIFVQERGLNSFIIVDFEKQTSTGTVYLPNQIRGFLGGFRNPSHGIAISPDSKTLWVNSGEANSVFVYSLPDLKLMNRVPLPVHRLPGGRMLGAQPNWLSFTPDGGKVYVSDTWLNSISVISTRTMKVVALIPIGELPRIVEVLTFP